MSRAYDRVASAATVDQSRHALTISMMSDAAACHTRAHLRAYAPDSAEESEDAAAMRLESEEVMHVARSRYEHGILVPNYQDEPEVSRLVSDRLLADSSVPVIFRPVIDGADLRVHPDVLVRNPAGFSLVAVTSSTAPKADHYLRLAFQLEACAAAGIPITDAQLHHLDPEYVRGAELDAHALFAVVDATEAATTLRPDAVAHVSETRRMLAQREMPEPEMGGHCKSPCACAFTKVCAALEPPHPIRELPFLSAKLKSALKEAGLKSIADIPPDFTGPTDPENKKRKPAKLSENQERVRAAVASGQTMLEPDGIIDLLGPALRDAPYIYSLDIEWVAFAVPRFPGTRSHEPLVNQYSYLKRDNRTGNIEQFFYVHRGTDNPEPAALRSLVDHVAGHVDPALVYSSAEDSKFEAGAKKYPDLAPGLEALRERLVDTLPLTRASFYHPSLKGSHSQKSTGQALVPDVSYEHLAIRNGSAAMQAGKRLLDPTCQPEEAEALEHNVREYCYVDTRVLLEASIRLLALAEATKAADGVVPPLSSVIPPVRPAAPLPSGPAPPPVSSLASAPAPSRGR
jgi:hypothetical protein